MQDTSQDEAAIRELFDRSSNAWEQADHDLFASVFAEDADFINITATPLRGRQEIAEHHARLWRRSTRGRRVHRAQCRIRFIRPDVAMVENEMTVKFGENERHAHGFAVAVRNGDSWEIAALQNMIPFVPPS